MKRLLKIGTGMILGAGTLSMCAAAAAQVALPAATTEAPVSAASSPPAPAATPLRVQYVQFAEYLDGGAPLPPPGSFDREFAKVMAQTPPPAVSRADVREAMARELAAMKVDEIKMRFKQMARGMVESLVDSAISAVGGPVAGRALGYAEEETLGKADIAARKRDEQEQELRSEQRQARVAQQQALQSLRHSTTVKRVSIWGSWVRIDNLRDHSAIVYKPDLHRYLMIDDAHKLYRVVSGSAPAPAAMPAFACQGQITLKPLGSRLLGGVQAHGYQLTTIMQLPDVTVNEQGAIYFWDTPLPPQVLAWATGRQPCPSDTPAGRAYPTGRLALYVSQTGGHASTGSTNARAGLIAAYEKQSGQSLPASERAAIAKMMAADSARLAANHNRDPKIETVLMRGHVRTLTDADLKLFEPPAGYQQVQ